MFQAGIFAVLNEKKEELEQQGRRIYNLSVGTPDFEPAPHVMAAVAEAAKKLPVCIDRQTISAGGGTGFLQESFWCGIDAGGNHDYQWLTGGHGAYYLGIVQSW